MENWLLFDADDTLWENNIYFEKALEDYYEAIRREPGFALAYQNRGEAYYDIREPTYAVEDYDEAIRLNPLSGETYAKRALAYTLLGKDMEAEEDVAMAVELGSNPGSLKLAIEELKEVSR